MGDTNLGEVVEAAPPWLQRQTDSEGSAGVQNLKCNGVNHDGGSNKSFRAWFRGVPTFID